MQQVHLNNNNKVLQNWNTGHIRVYCLVVFLNYKPGIFMSQCSQNTFHHRNAHTFKTIYSQQTECWIKHDTWFSELQLCFCSTAPLRSDVYSLWLFNATLCITVARQRAGKINISYRLRWEDTGYSGRQQQAYLPASTRNDIVKLLEQPAWFLKLLLSAALHCSLLDFFCLNWILCVLLYSVLNDSLFVLVVLIRIAVWLRL